MMMIIISYNKAKAGLDVVMTDVGFLEGPKPRAGNYREATCGSATRLIAR